jgi:hypothetical protein
VLEFAKMSVQLRRLNNKREAVRKTEQKKAETNGARLCQNHLTQEVCTQRQITIMERGHHFELPLQYAPRAGRADSTLRLQQGKQGDQTHGQRSKGDGLRNNTKRTSVFGRQQHDRAQLTFLCILDVPQHQGNADQNVLLTCFCTADTMCTEAAKRTTERVIFSIDDVPTLVKEQSNIKVGVATL